MIPIFCVIALILMSQTGSSTAAGTQPPRFELQRVVALPKKTKIQGILVGGLSDLVYDAKTQTYAAISDDKKQPRIHFFNESFEPSGVLLLKDATGNPLPPRRLDAEGLTQLKNGNWIVTTDGIFQLTRRKHPPEIIEFASTGKWIKNLPVPEPIQTQSRFNLGFEALSYHAPTAELCAGMENPVEPDGKPILLNWSGPARVVCGHMPEWNPVREFLYPISPVPMPPSEARGTGMNGVTDMLHWDGGLLVLERSYVAATQKYDFRIYWIDSFPTPPGVQTLTKILILDSATFKKRLPKSTVDNFEGMAEGPTLTNGHRTLVLVSDDNFYKPQSTQFLVFEVP